MPAHPTTPSVALDRVTFTWPDGTPALQQLSGAFGASRTGLIGRNGSGKSTLLSLIAGVHTPASGTLAVAGDVDLLPQRLTLLAQGRVHIERTARHQAACDVVLDCTDGPSVFRDPLAEQLFLARDQDRLISRRLCTSRESAIDSLALYLNELESIRRDRGKNQVR